MNNFVLGSGSGSEGMVIYSGSSDSGFIGFNDAAAAATQGVIEYNHSGNYMAFRTADTERMRITSGGEYEFRNASTTVLKSVDTSGSGATDYGQFQFKGIRGADNDSQTYMTIDSSGRLLVGTSSSRAVGYGDNTSLLLEGTSYPAAGISTVLNSNNINGPSLNFAKTRGTSNGSNTVVQDDDFLGVINFSGGDGTDLSSHGARIDCRVDGTPGANDMPGRLVFSTTADGASSPSERMKILSTGEVYIGNSTSNSSILTLQGGDLAVTSGDEFCQIKFLTRDTNVVGSDKECATIVAVAENDHGANSDAQTGLSFHTRKDELQAPYEQLRIRSNGVINARYIFQTGISDSATYTGGDVNYIRSFAGSTGNDYTIMRGRYVSNSNYVFASYVGGVLKSEIQADGSFHSAVNSYGSTSDARLKENIVDAGSQWEDIKGITVRKFNFTEESGHDTHTQIGVVAQEVELVSPGLVTEKPDLDADDNDLGTTTKSVKYSVLYMKAVKALQEAMERIETLEAKVAALEAA